MKKFVFSMLTLVGIGAFFVVSQTAYADCPNGLSGDDDIICSGTDDTDGVVTNTGNDTVTINAVDINNLGAYGIDFGENGIVQGDGNVSGDSNGIRALGTVINSGSGNITGVTLNGIQAGGVVNSGSGTISGGFTGILAGGNVSNSGSGNVSGGFNGIQANGNVTNSGSGTISGGFVGIQALGNVSNSGSGTVSGNIGIGGGGGDQTFTFSSGTITGTGGTAIYTEDGSDTVSITVGAVTINGIIDGGAGGSDTLTLNGTTNDAAGWNFFQSCMTTPAACGGVGPFNVTANGKTFTFTNFEAFINNMTLIIAAAGGAPIDITIGGDVPVQTGVQSVCDGSVKVFRQANGDLDVYSGFDFLPPNGFMVGRITQTELAAGGRRFQDIGTAAQLGWVVEVTLSDKLIIQVFDGQGNPIGTCQA